MFGKERTIGVLLSAGLVLWATSGAVFAKGPPAGHTNRGHAGATHGKSLNAHGKSSTAHGNSSSIHGNSHVSRTSTTGAGNSSHTGPPGNNGTVKIDNYADRNGNDIAHNNEPHVSCAFGVDAYGYEAAAPTGVETFMQHPPTAGGTSQTATLTNTNPRGTGATYNGFNSPTLSLVGTPHPKQGYHVKLTYQAADGNTQGNTVKHKVFWVRPCTHLAGTSVAGGGLTTTGPNVLAAFSTTAAPFRASTFNGVPTAVSAQATNGQPQFTG
jgi:hypothetical protein